MRFGRTSTIEVLQLGAEIEVRQLGAEIDECQAELWLLT